MPRHGFTSNPKVGVIFGKEMKDAEAVPPIHSRTKTLDERFAA